jgi:hypothetical protein
MSNKVVWDLVKFDTSITVPTSGIIETNFQFNLNQHPQVSNWTPLFDQWCIPQASVTFLSQLPPGATAPPSTLYTALDFDSVGTLGSVTAIEDYATCVVASMDTGRSVTRSVRPCTKLSTQQTSTNVNSSMNRSWQDSGAAGTPHYGIRSISTGNGAGYNIVATTTIWFAFRNQI